MNYLKDRGREKSRENSFFKNKISSVLLGSWKSNTADNNNTIADNNSNSSSSSTSTSTNLENLRVRKKAKSFVLNDKPKNLMTTTVSSSKKDTQIQNLKERHNSNKNSSASSPE